MELFIASAEWTGILGISMKAPPGIELRPCPQRSIILSRIDENLNFPSDFDANNFRVQLPVLMAKESDSECHANFVAHPNPLRLWRVRKGYKPSGIGLYPIASLATEC